MLARSRRAEKKLFTDDEKRNAARPTLKLQYVESEKSSNCVKVTEIFVEKVWNITYFCEWHQFQLAFFSPPEK